MSFYILMLQKFQIRNCSFSSQLLQVLSLLKHVCWFIQLLHSIYTMYCGSGSLIYRAPQKLLHNCVRLKLFAVITRSSKMFVLSFFKLADIPACPVKLYIFCFTISSLVVRYSLLELFFVVYVHFHSSLPGYHKAIWCKVLTFLVCSATLLLCWIQLF
jgi:hypothetical protein